jgi:hypothetical protein
MQEDLREIHVTGPQNVKYLPGRITTACDTVPLFSRMDVWRKGGERGIHHSAESAFRYVLQYFSFISNKSLSINCSLAYFYFMS